MNLICTIKEISTHQKFAKGEINHGGFSAHVYRYEIAGKQVHNVILYLSENVNEDTKYLEKVLPRICF